MIESASKAVFLSYASQDVEVARRICKALLNEPKNNTPVF